jgi:hypothetical protein
MASGDFRDKLLAGLGGEWPKGGELNSQVLEEKLVRRQVSLKAVSCGTDLSIVQEGVPEVIPIEMCYLGWQESLVQLATLVEPNIPDA